MSSRSIVVIPHVALSTRAEEVLNIDDHVRTLAKEMAQAMYGAPGIGLAANQVGELVRLIVLDLAYAYAEPKDKKKNPIFIINPKISVVEGKCVREEGCLSVPEFGIDIQRHECVSVQGVDLDGKPVKIEADGLLARALQHEIDHLNGITLLDYASPLKRNLYRRKLKKIGRRDR